MTQEFYFEGDHQLPPVTTPLNNFFYCFSEISVLAYKWWVYHRLNGFKLIGMLYYNRSYLMILVNDTNYNHGHNTLRLFDILSTVPFTTSETKFDY